MVKKDISGEKNPNYRTGFRTSNKNPSFYNTWLNMKARCLRTTHPKYKRYGGRGITICKEWLDIKNFADWSKKNGWEQGLTIDRIDNDGNYCPENCRWVSPSENSRKKSTTKISQETATEIRKRKDENWYDLAKEYGCSHANIWFIMHDITHVPYMECSRKLNERKQAF